MRARQDGVVRWPVALLVAMVGLLAGLGAAPAQAATPITSFYAGAIADGSTCTPDGEGVQPSRAAGTFSDFCIAFDTRTEPLAPPSADDLERVEVDTPTGYAAMAAGIPTCPLTGDAGFNASTNADVGCAAATQVGGARSDVRTVVAARSGNLANLEIANVTGRVFNLPRDSNEVAKLGIVLDPFAVIEQPKVKVVVSVRLRPAPDVGLRSVIENLPFEADVNPPNGTAQQRQPISVDTFALTLWGSKAAHPSLPVDFGYNGTDCTVDQRVSLRGSSYDGTPVAADSEPYRLTGCDDAAIPFAPSLQVRTDERRPDVTTATDVIVGFAPSTTPGRVASTVSSTVVRLPDGLSLSAQIASGGLALCTAEQFARTSNAAAACAPGTAVGTVRFTSPAVDGALTGNAYLGPQPAPGELPALYLEAALGDAADAPRVKLTGSLVVDDAGRVTATLADLPQLPVTEVALRFRGGDASVLVTPPTCGTTTGSLQATSHARPGAPVDATAPYVVDADCAGVGGFSPSVSFALDNPNSAGKSSPLTATIARADRSERIKSTTVNLPPGMLATLKGVPECSFADAAAGTCAAASRVGSIDTVAGVGNAPTKVSGGVYLTERRPGTVVGLVFRVPIVLGELDLGLLNVSADVRIRPTDQGLQVDATVPERFKGIPLNLRSLSIRLDREGFPLSPTSCKGLGTVSQLTSVGGTVANAPADLAVSGCDALPFTPVLETAVSGRTTEGQRPYTQVRVTAPAGSSALRQAYVKLPDGLGFDLRQLPRACSLEDFKATKCPAVASIGKVYGNLSITDERLSGELYLLKPVPGQPLPGIGLSYQGRYAANIAGSTRVDKDTGQLVSVFDTVPDLPLTSFQIDVAGGDQGVLIATAALCKDTVADFGAMFVGSAGKNAPRETGAVCGVALGAPRPTISGRLGGMRKGKPTISLRVTAPKPATGQRALTIRQVDVAVPSTWSIDSRRARSSKGIALKSLSAKGSTSTRKVTRTKMRLKMPTGGTSTVKVLTRTSTLSIAKKSVRTSKRKVPITVTVVYSDGSKAGIPLELTPR